MIEPYVAGIGFLLLLFFMALGFHVACVMFLISVIGATLYLGMPVTMEFGTQFWGATNNFVLVAVPLFVLLGELLVRGGFTDRMYKTLSEWLNPLPGGLLHTNIGASAIFAAVSGSSVATAATIGTVAVPALRGRGYNERLVLGSIASGATLGILIPPSINMLIYGAMVGVSVGRLYLAGIVPGILLTLSFMGTIALICLVKPSYAGATETPPPIAVRLRNLVALIPPAVVFILVMGSIYLGWATPTESAALGVVASLGLCFAYRTFSFRMLHECLVKTISITAMIMLITASAFYLNFVIGLMGVPQALADFVGSMGASQTALIFILAIFYLILGCFMDALAMVVGTIPIVYPIIRTMGIDPVWFGIYLVIMAELALITPPVGMNLYIVQGIRKQGSIIDVIIGVLPFLAIILAFLVLITFVPAIVLWLPNHSFG
ncbi:MAG: TRAP transporter large permease [Planctomycetes bacterium]|nr:TRAP transporter large permease [Planctomycetota bacterium]